MEKKSEIVKEIIGTASIYERGIDTHDFYSVYKGYEFSLCKEDEFSDWYIQVIEESGLCDYDGWWPDSGDKSLSDALAEAIDGAELFQDN